MSWRMPIEFSCYAVGCFSDRGRRPRRLPDAHVVEVGVRTSEDAGRSGNFVARTKRTSHVCQTSFSLPRSTGREIHRLRRPTDRTCPMRANATATSPSSIAPVGKARSSSEPNVSGTQGGSGPDPGSDRLLLPWSFAPEKAPDPSAAALRATTSAVLARRKGSAPTCLGCVKGSSTYPGTWQAEIWKFDTHKSRGKSAARSRG